MRSASRSRFDLQDALGAREGERLDHGRDKRGLCRHLCVRNRERLVAFGFCGELGRDEVGPWNRGHGVEHARVGDAGERSGRSERVLGHAASMRRMKFRLPHGRSRKSWVRLGGVP